MNNSVNDLMNSRGKKIPAMTLVQKEPAVAAAISKLLNSRDPVQNIANRQKQDYLVNPAALKNISDSIGGQVNDNENITQLFPDIELAIQILVSSVLAPKDMVKTELIYKTSETVVPSVVHNKMIDIIKNAMKAQYGIEDILGDILRESLFTTGSYIRAVLPESLVDEIINGKKDISLESMSELFDNTQGLSKSLGILGKPTQNPISRSSMVLESLSNTNSVVTESERYIGITEGNIFKPFDTHVEVTDNFKLLKLPLINKKNVSNNIRSRYMSSVNVSTESVVSPTEFSSMVYKGVNSQVEPFVIAPSKYTLKRKSIGKPLIMKLPSESVIPVCTPGNPKKHVGYFVLIDMDGNPISCKSETNNQNSVGGLDSLRANATSSSGDNQNLSGSLIEKAKRNLTGTNGKDLVIGDIVKAYSTIVEKDLIERLRNGLYKSELAIAGNEEIYRIMLSRSLANKYCRLLYIPEEFVSYFAFKYHSSGVGKSYLDDLKILTSVRAISLFSKIMAHIKSSINITGVNISLDPKDPDPAKTIEIIKDEYAKIRQSHFPVGINSPVDIVRWLQSAGFEFSFENHPGLPETKITTEVKNLQHTLPDNELDEMLRKQTYMAFGLSPETVDNGFNAEFATTVVSNNILLSKRVIQIQDAFKVPLTDHIKKIVLNDSFILRELKNAIKENAAVVRKYYESDALIKKRINDEDSNTDDTVLANAVVEYFLDALSVEFPRPDETTVETQSVAFDAYSEAVDKLINYFVSSEFITSETAGDISSTTDSIKAMMKAYFMRKWAAENNYLSELNDIVTSNEDGNAKFDLYDVNRQHIEGLMKSILKFMQSSKPAISASNQDLSNMNVEGSGSSDSSSDSSSDDSSSDDGGMDDFGGDMDTGDTTEDIGDSTETPDEDTDKDNEEDKE